MTVDTYRRRIASMAIVLAREDPLLVKEVIARLRASGEIAADAYPAVRPLTTTANSSAAYDAALAAARAISC